MPDGAACRLSDGGSPDDIIRRVFALKTFAVVGCSPKPERPSHYVTAYMMEQGYRVIPVNPGHDELLGQACYPDVAAIPFAIDGVVVFRRPEETDEPIEHAIRKKAKALWLQDGIANAAGEARAREAGLLVVSNDCFMRRHMRSR